MLTIEKVEAEFTSDLASGSGVRHSGGRKRTHRVLESDGILSLFFIHTYSATPPADDEDVLAESIGRSKGKEREPKVERKSPSLG